MAAEAVPTTGFTRRQTQVVALIAAGYSADEIAASLGISARTVRAHCDALRAKLRVPRRSQIPAAFLWRTGIDPFTLLTW